MKKILALLLVAVMAVPVLALSSCGAKGFDYQNENLDAYVTLPNFKTDKLAADIADLSETITDDDVNKSIDDKLVSGKAYWEKLTTGTVQYGDSVGMLYKGVLVTDIAEKYPVKCLPDANGKLTVAQLQSLTTDEISALTAFSGGEAKTDTDVVIGAGKYVDGFESGLIGQEIGVKNYPLCVTFPETYTANSTLAGKNVVFFTTLDYKLRLVDERDLDIGDTVAMKYEIHLDPSDSAFAEYFNDETTAPVNTVVVLSKDNLFHQALKIAFNAKRAENNGSAFNVELTFQENQNVSYTDDQDQPKTQQVKVNYTVTVYAISAVKYKTHVEVAAGTMTYADFCTAISIKSEDYATYNDYFTYLKNDMQTTRTKQVTANKYQAAFDALVKAATLHLDADPMPTLIANYQSEVKGNIEYYCTYYKAQGMESTYNSLASYYGLTDMEAYVMYTLYGYKTKTELTTKLPTDAENYVSERLVFWQLVKQENITLSDEEYTAGVENYKKLYGKDTFMEDNNLSEQNVREALLWDKVAAYLQDYVNYTVKPAKEAA